MKVCRIKIGNETSYELVNRPPTKRACDLFMLTETYDEEHEPYDSEMPCGGILALSDIIKDVLSFLSIIDDRIYPKPGIDHETIYEELREMMYPEAASSCSMDWFNRIDEYAAADFPKSICEKHEIDHEAFYKKLRERVCAEGSINPDALALFSRIDEYEAAYNA